MDEEMVVYIGQIRAKGSIDPTKILIADLVDAKHFDNFGIISQVEF
jgi:hypothetical protein